MRKFKNIMLAAAMVCTMGNSFANTKVIAHRGFWNCEGSAQNSIAALEKAAQAGVYGSEFDVLITSDGIPVVNHDDNIEGFVIEQTPYEKISSLKLSNGEVLPTLKSYLQAGKKYPDTRLILEIKPHKSEENENRAVATIVDMVKDMGMVNQVEYISFSMNICKQLVDKSPASEIAYLMSDVKPADIKKIGLSGIDYHYKAFDKYPEWVSEAHKEGMTVNVWTVNSVEAMKKLIDLKVNFITTDDPIGAMKLLEE